MPCFCTILAILLATTSGSAVTRSFPYKDWPLVTNTRPAHTAIFATPTRKVRFSFDATVSFRHLPGFPYLAVKDGTGNLMMILDDRQSGRSYEVGDRLHVVGRATAKEPTISDAYCEDAVVLGRSTNVTSFIRSVSGNELLAGAADCAPVRLSGILTACFTDDADPHFRCLIVEADNRAIYCTMTNAGEEEARTVSRLVGKCVTVTGLCHPRPPSPRLHAGRVVFIQSREDIRATPDLEDKIFQALEIDAIRDRQMSEITGLGRHRTVGRVLTAFRNGNVILSDHSGSVLHIHLVGAELPEIGDVIEVLGIPTPDLYHINLVRAIWRKSLPAEAAPVRPDKTVSSCELAGELLRPNHLGCAVRVSGKLVSVQSSPDHGRCLFIDDGCQLVKVVVRDGLYPILPTPGSTIEATGICVLETDADRVRDGYTRLRGFFVVPSEPGALRLRRQPSWWTPLRLFLAIAVLIVAAVSICIWNLLLKMSVKRKSRQLEQEISKRISSDIKVLERTRLAVELHDALSQTLTGVSMEIRAAQKSLPPSSDRCQGHLARAERTVDACRGELRDCIWDLRNDTMDNPDMNEAIRRTLAPHLGIASLSVRFSVPRDRFSDNTTHAILRIVRELTVNAIRHGRANAIRVAGVIENGRFLFSVRDNGCGFDPATAPGISEGHFGLQGIRERVDRFEGDLVIDSTKGKGTKITVILSLPRGTPS